MSSIFDKSGRMYYDRRITERKGMKYLWQYAWYRDRRQLIHKGRKP